MSKKLSNKELRELMSEQRYSIEALEDEIENLEEINRNQHEKLWEVIQENDRLTITYEPYRPPGDEHEDLDFYSLVEENDELTHKILDKIEIINEQDEELRDLRNALIELRHKKDPQIPFPKKVKHKKGGVVSLDIWPPSDWFRLNYNSWDPGMAAQLCVGPVRIDWFAL